MPNPAIQSIGAMLVALGFCLPLAGYVYSQARGSTDINVFENRTVNPLPEYEGDAKQFTQALDKHFEDSFGLRRYLIRTARTVRDNLGEDPAQVVTGKDGWLFLGRLRYRDEFEGQGWWDEQQAQSWIDALASANSQLAIRNIPFAAVIAVDKARAYPEMLPADWVESPRRFRSAVHALDNDGKAGLVDAEKYVLQAKTSGLQVFYRRDTHWTSNATYGLAMAVLDRLDPEGALPRYDPGVAKVTRPKRIGDLETLSGAEQTSELPLALLTFPDYGPRGVTTLEPKSDSSPHRGQFATLVLDGTHQHSDQRLVIVGDSFADTMLPHFLPSYSEIVRIHHGAHHFDVSVEEILSYDPAAVLFITAERQAARKSLPLIVSGSDVGPG